MSVFSVSAAESYELIPAGATWSKTDNGGASVTVTENEDSIVFSGSVSGTWPCVDTYYASDAIIRVDIDEYSLVYDFDVAGGAININFYFTDGFGSSSTYTIANNTLGNVNYDTGSGDLYDGDYRGVVKLSDFVNATKFYDGSTFDSNFITEDNEIIFTGIQVYSVNGGAVTVKALDIVHNDDAELPAGEESSEAVSEEESSEAASEAESSEAESKTESKAESKAESAEESTEASADESTVDNEDDGLGVWLYVIIGVAVLAVIAVVAVLVKKKK